MTGFTVNTQEMRNLVPAAIKYIQKRVYETQEDIRRVSRIRPKILNNPCRLEFIGDIFESNKRSLGKLRNMLERLTIIGDVITPYGSVPETMFLSIEDAKIIYECIEWMDERTSTEKAQDAIREIIG